MSNFQGHLIFVTVLAFTRFIWHPSTSPSWGWRHCSASVGFSFFFFQLWNWNIRQILMSSHQLLCCQFIFKDGESFDTLKGLSRVFEKAHLPWLCVMNVALAAISGIFCGRSVSCMSFEVWSWRFPHPQFSVLSLANGIFAFYMACIHIMTFVSKVGLCMHLVTSYSSPKVRQWWCKMFILPNCTAVVPAIFEPETLI